MKLAGIGRVFRIKATPMGDKLFFPLTLFHHVDELNCREHECIYSDRNLVHNYISNLGIVIAWRVASNDILVRSLHQEESGTPSSFPLIAINLTRNHSPEITTLSQFRCI